MVHKHQITTKTQQKHQITPQKPQKHQITPQKTTEKENYMSSQLPVQEANQGAARRDAKRDDPKVERHSFHLHSDPDGLCLLTIPQPGRAHHEGILHNKNNKFYHDEYSGKGLARGGATVTDVKTSLKCSDACLKGIS